MFRRLGRALCLLYGGCVFASDFWVHEGSYKKMAARKGSHLLEWLREMPSPVTSENSRVARTGLDGSRDCSN